MTQPKVFISVASAIENRKSDAEAAETIFNTLRNIGLSPRQMNKNEWSYNQPLRAIRRIIEECDGAVVIAFSCYHFPSGSEFTKSGTKPLENLRLPTVWNQVEAAMAYTRGLPLLVIAEHGLKSEGLLENRYDWNVYWTKWEPEDLRSDKFRGWLDSWKQAVLEHAQQRSASKQDTQVDPSKLTIGQILNSLSVPQIWALCSAVAGLLLAVATAGYRLGRGIWPWQ